MKFRDYYEVMGVPRNATANEIKTAYRRLARTFRPDLQPTEKRAETAERFKEIGEAYAVLGDPEKRRKYDALGEGWKNGQDFTPPPGTTATGARGSGDTGSWEEFGDVSDFFASMFGGGEDRPAPRASAGATSARPCPAATSRPRYP